MASMLTAFILAKDDAKALTRTLNALISATVDGLVREVIIVAEARNDMAAKMADHAGSDLVAPSEFSNALSAAKGDWLLILEAGALPELGWAEQIGDHTQNSGQAAKFRRSPLAARPFLQRLVQAEKPLALGLLIEKRHAVSLGKAAMASPENLAKAAKPKPMLASLRPA